MPDDATPSSSRPGAAGAFASAPRPDEREASPLAPDWLEDLDDERARAWVDAHNAATGAAHAGPSLEARARDIEALLDDPDRIPAVASRHGMLYNFWTDAARPRGVWRRTTWESYILGAPVRADRDPAPAQWEELLDVDALARERGRALTWGGAQVLTTGALAGRRALVNLSQGGSDASWTQEYDLAERRFVPPREGGFRRGLSKGSMSWGDDEGECVIVAADLGPGSLSAAGYPLQVRRVGRGRAVEEGGVLVCAAPDAVAARAARDPWGRTWVMTMPTFYATRVWLLPDDVAAPSGVGRALPGAGREWVPDGAVRLDVPESASAGVGRDWATIELRRPWKVDGRTYAPGTLLAAPLQGLLEGCRELVVLFEPTATTSLASAAWTRNHLVLTILDDVVNRLEVCTPPSARRTAAGDWRWGRRRVDLTGAADPPGRSEGGGTRLRPGRALLDVSVSALDARDTDYLWICVSGWTTPSTLAVGRVTRSGGVDGMTVVRQAPARYDAAGVRVSQHLATSADGTRVPYFQVGRHRGPAPTLVVAYGAFGVSLTPGYDPVVGKGWLERGGTLIVANTRGGGEYGPAWHRRALGRGRRLVVEDLVAVLESVIRRGVAAPSGIAVHGSSAGGLLVGELLTRRPDLLGAAVMEVPLTDLERYSRLLSGASWVEEFGDPDDPEQWAWMREHSPLHRLREGVEYPPVLLVTSQKDDRVHPWHARAMAHRLEELGGRVFYLETAEGGHAGRATSAVRARTSALIHEFAWRRTSG